MRRSQSKKSSAKISKRKSQKKTQKRSEKTHKRSDKKKKSNKKTKSITNKRRKSKRSQKGNGYGDAEYLNAMRRPIESPFDNVQPTMKRLMEDHDLSMKDALFIGVAEMLYPTQAKAYYDTVDKLMKKGYSIRDAAKIAFEQYMEFYKEMSKKTAAQKVAPKEKKSMLKDYFNKKQMKQSEPKIYKSSLFS